MRIVVPFGFYGWGNIGDEATLNGFAQLLERSGMKATVSAGSRNTKHTSRVEPKFRYFNPRSNDPRRWWAKYRATAHAVVGGTPIGDVLGDWPLSELTPLVRSIDRWRVPLACIGIGVESLRHEKSRVLIADDYAHRVNHWSVRSERDKQRLTDYKISPERITVAADMAWLIESVSTQFGSALLRELGVDLQRPLIGVSLVNENSLFEKEPAFVAHIAAGLDSLVEQLGATIIFLSNEVRVDSCFDIAAAKYVVDRMKHVEATRIAPNDYHSPRGMMSIIGCCSATISMRYHFCLFSALQEVPFFAIERSDKVADLCWDLAWSAAAAPLAVDGNTLHDTLLQFHQHRPLFSAKLRDSTLLMRARAMKNIAALNVLQK